MGIGILLYTVCICGFYTCSSRELPSEDCAVDLAKPDASKCAQIECKIDGVDAHILLPREKNVKQVVDGEVTVWDVNLEYERCAYCVAFLRGDKPEFLHIVKETPSGFFNILYEKRKDNGWEVSKGKFNNKVLNLRKVSWPPSTFSLDLSLTQNSNHCTIFQDELYGVSTRFYVPKNGHHAKEVKDGSAILWKAEEGDYIVEALFYFVKDEAIGVKITHGVNKKAKKFCLFAKKEWSFVDEADFWSSVKEANTESSPKEEPTLHQEQEKPFTDLAAKVDGNLFTTEEGVEKGVPVLKLTPKDGVTATKLTFDNKVIWETENDGRCILIIAHFENGELSIVDAWLRGNKNVVNHQYWKRADQKWKGVDKVTYNHTFKEWSSDFQKSDFFNVKILKPEESTFNDIARSLHES